MGGLIGSIAPVLIPTFLLPLAGFLWSRSPVPFETAFVTRIVVYIGSPCLIFGTLAAADIPREAFLDMAGASVLAHFSFAALGALVIWASRMHVRTYLAPFTLANGGNLGLPVCLFAFGQEGLALGISYFVIQSVLMFTFGVWLMSGQASLKPLLKMPMLYAAAAGIAVTVLEVEVPRWIMNTATLTGGMVIPLMLITLGVSLGRLNPKGLGRSLWLSLVKLGIGIGAGFVLADLFGMTGAARGVLILQCAMPAAVYTYLFTEHYGGRSEEVAGVVFVSTLLVVLALPPLVGYVLTTAS